MKEKILFVVRLLFGLMFINAGLNKFFNYMPPPDDLPQRLLDTMAAFNEIGWLMPLVGFVEIIGGLLFIPNKTKALGAIVILPIMIGILFTNFTVAPSGLPIALILFGINIWVIFENRIKYAPMIQ